METGKLSLNRLPEETNHRHAVTKRSIPLPSLDLSHDDRMNSTVSLLSSIFLPAWLVSSANPHFTLFPPSG